MAFEFLRGRSRARDGVAVSSAEVAAARLIVQRAKVSNKPVGDAVLAIANAEPVPGSTTSYRVVDFQRGSGSQSGPVAPAGGAAAQ
jgi:hypothetical protein